MNNIFVAALLSVALAAPVRAERVEIVVTLSAADLASAKRLKQRVASAIEQMCGSYATVEHYQWPMIDDCRATAWTSAQQQIASIEKRNTIRLTSR